MLQSMGSQRVGHDLATKQQKQYRLVNKTGRDLDAALYLNCRPEIILRLKHFW